ncbi:MAG: hypothetical protein HYU99_01900 [Deltaproteobacteria bacterium]|nr:hypothetical protein [Deltaproteobacteria bacterium]
MATDITTYTTNEEVSAIYAFYTTDEGAIDYDAIATAIEAGDTSAGTIEDLITAYVSGTGQLTPVMMSPEAYISGPDDYLWLWEEEVVSNLEQLGDLYTSLEPAITDFLSHRTSSGSTEATSAATAVVAESALKASVIDDVEDFLSEYEIENTDEAADDVYNLFSSQDLSEVMSLFISLGNPGLALLMYTAYGLGPQMQELQEAAVEVMEDGSEEMEDILDDIQGLDPEDLSAQYDSQALSQQLNVVSTVISTMSEFIQNAQDVLDEMVELASNLSEQTSRTTQSIIRNIG